MLHMKYALFFLYLFYKMVKTQPTKQQIVEKTKKAFAPPTKRQLEQQAQARARGGLTSRGIRKFKSKTKAEQQALVEREREK